MVWLPSKVPTNSKERIPPGAASVSNGFPVISIPIIVIAVKQNRIQKILTPVFWFKISTTAIKIIYIFPYHTFRPILLVLQLEETWYIFSNQDNILYAISIFVLKMILDCYHIVLWKYSCYTFVLALFFPLLKDPLYHKTIYLSKNHQNLKFLEFSSPKCNKPHSKLNSIFAITWKRETGKYLHRFKFSMTMLFWLKFHRSFYLWLSK